MTRKQSSLNFFEHVDELRDRIVKCLVFIFCAAVFSYFFIDSILAYIIQPIGQIVFTSPGDAFITRFTLSIFCGVILSSPYFFVHVWQFISEGLKDREKRLARIYGPFSIIAFFVGAAFAYFIIIPISLQFLMSFSTDYIVPMITIESYISFISTMVLVFGIVFELPLVLLILTKLGIATPAFLIQKRRYAIVGILIVSAIVTPPDFVTQLMLAVPLVILYEVGVTLSKIVYRDEISKKKTAHPS